MVPVLVSTRDLENVISDVLNDQLGTCFPCDVSNLVSRLCDSYCYSGDENLIDAALEGVRFKLQDYAPIDMIVEMFCSLVGGYVDISTHTPILEYRAVDETITITSRLKPRQSVAHFLIDEYKHAESQGDYIPERLRRAIEGLR